MANVEVKISGDNSDLLRKLKQSEKETENFAKSAGQSTSGISRGFRNAISNVKKFGGVIAGGLGLGAISLGMRAFGSITKEVMENARKQAQQTQTAFEDAFSATLKFETENPSFTIKTREQAVAAGRVAKQELNRISGELERNFGPLINSKAFQEILSGSLAVSSLVGLGQQQKARLNLLLEEKGIIETQLDKYRQIEQSLVFQAKIAKQLTSLGIERDKETPSASDVKDYLRSFAAPVPGIFDTFNLFDQLRRLKSDPTLKDFLGGPASAQNLANALPGQRERSFTEEIDTAKIVRLGQEIENAFNPFEKLRAETDLYREALDNMILRGVDPSSEAFLRMQETLNASIVSFGNIRAGIGILQETLLGFADVLTDAFDKYILKVDSAVSATDRLKGIGRSIFSSVLRAGVGVGIGALTGNPITFGAALGGALGITGAAPPGQRDSLSFAPATTGTAPSLNLSLDSTVISGGDILIGLREANATRDGRGGRINI